jgi:membrane-bound ClpP family serine protease
LVHRHRHHHWRVRVVAALALFVWGSASLLFATNASAQDRDEGRRGILVVQVEGTLDPPNAELVSDAIDRANDDGLTMVVLQLDSNGALDISVPDLVRQVRRSAVPIVVWVGPAGGEARGGAALLLEAAHVAFAAQAHLGRVSAQDRRQLAEAHVRIASVALSARELATFARHALTSLRLHPVTVARWVGNAIAARVRRIRSALARRS